MAEQLNIYQKLARIRKQVEVMKRDTKAYGYSYVKEEDILAKVTAMMEKYHLSLIPGIVHGTMRVAPYTYKKTKTTARGDIFEEHVNEVLVSADTVFTWVNDENPEEKIVVDWAMVGQQSDASQSFGSGLTYSNRYFLLKYFNVSTSNDDPDKWRSKQKEAEIAESKAIAEQIIGLVDERVKLYLTSHPADAAAVKDFMSSYAKDGNYFTIADPIIAQKLLESFCEKFKVE